MAYLHTVRQQRGFIAQRAIIIKQPFEGELVLRIHIKQFHI